MNRRSFLTSAFTGALVFIASKLPWNNYGAVFEVVYEDPDGSGMDYRGHLGSHVFNAKRCCNNCTIIFAAFAPGSDVDNGPCFVPGELKPINGAAKRLQAEIDVSRLDCLVPLQEQTQRTWYAAPRV
jgi:hypothetical protein